MRRQTPVKRLPKRDVPSFEDGIMRRSPKLAQAVYNRLLQVAARKVSAEPKVQRLLRAKCVNRVALDENLNRHGRKCASAEFLRPRGVFSKFCSPLDYASARIILFQKDEKLVPHDRRTVLYSEWGRKARMGLPTKYAFCGVPGRRGISVPSRDVQKISRALSTCAR